MSINKSLKAYVRYDVTGKIVPSSLIFAESMPKVGKWKEINAYPTTSPTTTTSITYQVGDLALGGIVAYIYQSGDPGYDENVQHGLIASVTDLGNYEWGCSGTTVGASGTVLGTGAANTAAILANCATRPIAASIAAAHDGGGFTDWFLPSYDELNKLYLNQSIIGGFFGSQYLSSREGSATNVCTQTFTTGVRSCAGLKSTSTRIVRAVRYF